MREFLEALLYLNAAMAAVGLTVVFAAWVSMVVLLGRDALRKK